jgi:hypothetical protein
MCIFSHQDYEISAEELDESEVVKKEKKPKED